MKKTLITLAASLMIGSAMADSVTIEAQNQKYVPPSTGTNVALYAISYKRDIAKNIALDVGQSTTAQTVTEKLGFRQEAGLTGSTDLGTFGAYTRVAYGEKYDGTKHFPYYAIEPGVTTPVGPLTAKVGWRYRTAVNGAANNDQTHTMRYGVSYNLTKVDAVGARYDRMRGDTKLNIWAVNYTRSF